MIEKGSEGDFGESRCLLTLLVYERVRAGEETTEGKTTLLTNLC